MARSAKQLQELPRASAGRLRVVAPGTPRPPAGRGALDTLITAERLRLVPITTPAASPQSNGMSEAFVNTLRRDYLAGADRSTAALVLEQIPAWIADYNAVAPHSALGFQSPQQYRSTRLMAGLKC